MLPLGIVPASHSRAVLSSEAVTTRVPSGEKAALRTPLSWPRRTAISLPAAASQWLIDEILDLSNQRYGLPYCLARSQRPPYNRSDTRRACRRHRLAKPEASMGALARASHELNNDITPFLSSPSFMRHFRDLLRGCEKSVRKRSGNGERS